jgi:hypothetical protein
MRNFAILHIVADESRIFKTKERAPVMLCFEVYRPIELSLDKWPAYADFKQKAEVEVIQVEMPSFNTNKRKEMSRSTTVRPSLTISDESFYPF